MMELVGGPEKVREKLLSKLSDDQKRKIITDTKESVLSKEDPRPFWVKQYHKGTWYAWITTEPTGRYVYYNKWKAERK